MTDAPVATPYDRARLVDVVIHHPMLDGAKMGSVYANPCACGFGTRPADLGESHAEHVADVYEASVLAAEGVAAPLPTPHIQIDPGDAIFLNGERYIPASSLTPVAWLGPDTNEVVTHEPEDPSHWVRLYRKDEG